MENLSITEDVIIGSHSKTTEYDKNGFEVDYTEPIPRFSVSSPTSVQEGVDYLHENGYAVFSNVLSDDEIKTNKDLLWEFLEQLPNSHIKRDKPETWSDNWPGMSYTGILYDQGIGQSKFVWSVRNNRNIKKVFSDIWQTNELLVSFDGAGCFRDWSYDDSWKTSNGWIHVDQHPIKKPNQCCVQGLVAITDNDESTGGLIVYPKSHHRFSELVGLIPPWDVGHDYVKIQPEHQILKQINSSEKIVFKLVKCKAGDLVVWDSRVIHCNTPAFKIPSHKMKYDLIRIVAYVSMSPTSFVSEGQNYKTLDEFRKLRKKCVISNCTTTHWSQELHIASDAPNIPKFSIKNLNSYQRSLIIGTNAEDD
ncbi:unnamed protein product, partial [Didymodactylos carnosus]